MPIYFELEDLRKQYDCKNYFETGMWDPESSHVSIHNAIKSNFDTIHSIEIKKEWVEKANKMFKNNNKVNIYLDDSINLYKYLNNDCFKNKTLFFLDAHIDNCFIGDGIQYKIRTPLLEELNAIQLLSRKDNIILIDDLRIINSNKWNESKYINVNLIEIIKSKILEINNEYKFKYFDGEIKNDVLCAYI